MNLGPQSGEYGGPAPSQPSATGTGHGDSSGIQTPPLYNDWRMTPIQRPEDFNDNFPALSDPDHHYNGNVRASLFDPRPVKLAGPKHWPRSVHFSLSLDLNRKAQLAGVDTNTT